MFEKTIVCLFLAILGMWLKFESRRECRYLTTFVRWSRHQSELKFDLNLIHVIRSLIFFSVCISILYWYYNSKKAWSVSDGLPMLTDGIVWYTVNLLHNLHTAYFCIKLFFSTVIWLLCCLGYVIEGDFADFLLIFHDQQLTAFLYFFTFI